MANSLQKTTMNNYLPSNHMNMIGQQPNNLGTNSLTKQHNILTYGNTKPLTHFNADLNPRMTPPMANPNKNPLMPYIQQQPPQPQPQPQPPQQQPPPPPQLQAPRALLSEDQKRMLLMKQKGVMNPPMAYAALPAHGQVSEPRRTVAAVLIRVPGCPVCTVGARLGLKWSPITSRNPLLCIFVWFLLRAGEREVQ